jgi:hypothetical protein
MEIPDKRNKAAHLIELLTDFRNRARRRRRIDGQPNKLAARPRQIKHLSDRCFNIFGCRIGHGLDDNGHSAPDLHPATLVLNQNPMGDPAAFVDIHLSDAPVSTS